MKITDYIRVFGTKKQTGEYRLVFRCITLENWIKIGKKNAIENGYENFEFYSIGNVRNHFLEQKINLV